MRVFDSDALGVGRDGSMFGVLHIRVALGLAMVLGLRASRVAGSNVLGFRVSSQRPRAKGFQGWCSKALRPPPPQCHHVGLLLPIPPPLLSFRVSFFAKSPSAVGFPHPWMGRPSSRRGRIPWTDPRLHAHKLKLRHSRTRITRLPGVSHVPEGAGPQI